MDNDSKMIKAMSNALIDLQVKYRASKLADRMEMKQALEDLLNKFSTFQIALLKEGTITNDSDLLEMSQIKNEIQVAANKQQLIAAMGKTISFIISKA